VSTAFPREEVRTLLAKLADFPVSNVIYRDEPEPMVAPKRGTITGLIRLDLSKRGSVGNDEVRRAYDVGTQVQTETYGGQRSLSLLVRVEAHSGLASDVLEKLRLRLNFESSLQVFRDNDLALANWGAITPIPNPRDNRQISTAVLELMLNGVVYETDPTPAGWIEKVNKAVPVDPGAAPVVDLEGDYSI
jgi:hypothetical protein